MELIASILLILSTLAACASAYCSWRSVQTSEKIAKDHYNYLRMSSFRLNIQSLINDGSMGDLDIHIECSVREICRDMKGANMPQDVEVKGYIDYVKHTYSIYQYAHDLQEFTHSLLSCRDKAYNLGIMNEMRESFTPSIRAALALYWHIAGYKELKNPHSPIREVDLHDYLGKLARCEDYNITSVDKDRAIKKAIEQLSKIYDQNRVEVVPFDEVLPKAAKKDKPK